MRTSYKSDQIKKGMKKVILLEPVLAHYRRDVFNYLTTQTEFDFEIVAGRNYQGIKGVEIEKKTLFNHSSLRIFNHTFYYLFGSVGYILKQKPEVLVSTGVDFHLIHSWILFIVHRLILRRDFYWWSHANFGNQGKLGFLIRKFVYKNSTGILSYNHEGRRNLVKMGIDDRRIKIVNNSLNREDYGYLNHDILKAKRNDLFTILYSGRITKAKKIDILVKALGLIKASKSVNFKCIIIGDGDLQEIINLSNTLNLKDDIDFVGEKYGAEAHPYFLRSHLFIYPGGIGLSIVHALSFGLPVITNDSKCSHFPEFELLKQGFNGDLFKNDSPEDLANKIIEWEKKTRDSGDIYSKNCIQRIEDCEYLPEKMYANVIDFLKSNS